MTAAALSLSALTGCSDNNSGGTNPTNNPDGGGDTADLLSVTPPPGAVRLSVTKGGTGTGVVSSQPAGIDCGSACVFDYPSGTMVTLTAQGSAGSAFAGWSGACAGQGGSCQLTLTADVSTNANFIPLSCTLDGICWEAPLPFGYDFNSVFAVAKDDVWAVGNSGAIVHFDGKSWKRVESGTTADLASIWARSKSEIYVAAGTGGVLKYDGNVWSKFDTTGIAEATSAIFGTGTNTLYATVRTSAVYRHDGTKWTKYTGLGVRGTVVMYGLTGTTEPNVIAYGSEAGITKWNGTSWAGSTNIFFPVNMQMISPTSVYGIADTGELYKSTNGSTYTKISTVPMTGLSVAGLWGNADNNLYTSGSPGMLYRYDATKWTAIDTGVKDIGKYLAIHGSANDDVWAVGQRGAIAHWDTVTPSVSRSNIFSGEFLGVWGSDPRNIYFLTNKRTLVHYKVPGSVLVEKALFFSAGQRLGNDWSRFPAV